MIHRSLVKQRSDFMLLAKQVHPVRGLLQPKAKQSGQSLPFVKPTPLHQTVRAILELTGELTYFKLTKLLYLIDFHATERLGLPFAGDIYIRQFDGPWLPTLNAELEKMERFEVRRFFAHRLSMVAPGPCPRFKVELDDAVLDIITEIVEKYGPLTNSRIKTAVYQTEPMRQILKEERAGKDMRNKPVLYRSPKSQLGSAHGRLQV